MPMDSPLHEDSADVAIIGAGFSGTIAAIHLLKQTDDQITVALVERTSEFGEGWLTGLATGPTVECTRGKDGRLS
jgi:cation diffusion facilitator CzcD-associated flavoprotein CzcO